MINWGNIISAILGSMLTITGLFISSKINHMYWKEQFIIEEHKQVLETKRKLLQETTVILNKTDLMKMYMTYRNKINGKNNLDDGDFDKIIELREKIANLNSTFNSLQTLNSNYFGKRCDSISHLINKIPFWWENDPKLFNEYIKSMAQEINQLK